MPYAYAYADLRPSLFAEEGAEKLERVRRNVRRMLKESGAVRATEAWRGVGGDGWLMIAALDYLAEKGEIREVTGPDEVTQYRVYVAGPNAPQA
jgi:hypothetical protein